MYYEEKQKLLEAVDLAGPVPGTEPDFWRMRSSIMRIKRDLQAKVKERVDKNQREYLLREQLKYIREELGEDNTLSDAEHFEEQLAGLEADEDIKEKIAKEISRFKNVGQNNSEGAVLRGYIETMLELPWDKTSQDNTDIGNAGKVLDEDHYGLEKVKERVLEFLAVRTLTKKGRQPHSLSGGPAGNR